MWLLSGIFMGWSLGSNDAGNVFGTAVASRMVRFWTAAILASIFVILGAMLEGQAGLETLQSLTQQDMTSAGVVLLSSALTVTLMTLLGVPVSATQGVFGAILAVSYVRQTGDIQWGGASKLVACWIGTPIGAAILAILLTVTLSRLIRWLKPGIFMLDFYLRTGLILAGCYGSYALGANNVANVTGPFYKLGGLFDSAWLLLLVGGGSIAFGILTYSKNVMMTVGQNLVKLDAFSAFVVVAAHSLTVHFYAMIGAPVSSSQAIVGAALGLGILHGLQTIRFVVLWRILFAWVGTPILAAGSCALILYTIKWFSPE